MLSGRRRAGSTSDVESQGLSPLRNLRADINGFWQWRSASGLEERDASRRLLRAGLAGETLTSQKGTRERKAAGEPISDTLVGHLCRGVGTLGSPFLHPPDLCRQVLATGRLSGSLARATSV